MLKIISNGRDKNKPDWVTNSKGTIGDLIEVLGKYTLDPIFEEYGNFINYNPVWTKKDLKEKYNNCVVISGNFLTYSHVFYIITDNKELINKLKKIIDNNKNTQNYINAKKKMIEQEKQRTYLRKKFEKGEIDLKEMYKLQTEI